MKHAALYISLMLSVFVCRGAETKPNILFIMSGDHAAHAIGAYGGRLTPLNPTPALDKMAAQGVVMENTFCNNSVCSPSRASILTGQYSHINGVRSLGGKVPEDKQALPLEMRKAGYQTAVIGKWHLGIQPLAFDYYKVLKGQGKYHDPEFFERASPEAEETQYIQQGYCSDLIAASSTQWLKQRDKTRPFMLLTHFKAPHGPWDAAERYHALYADIDIPEPESLWDNGKNGSIATRGHNDELLFNIGSSIGRRNTFRSHIKNDPLEMNNLYGNPEYAGVTEELKTRLQATRAEVGDSDDDYPHIAEIVAGHWDGGEEETVRLSHQVAQQPVNAKKTKDVKPKRPGERKSGPSGNSVGLSQGSR